MCGCKVGTFYHWNRRKTLVLKDGIFGRNKSQMLRIKINGRLCLLADADAIHWTENYIYVCQCVNVYNAVDIKNGPGQNRSYQIGCQLWIFVFAYSQEPKPIPYPYRTGPQNSLAFFLIVFSATSFKIHIDLLKLFKS